MKHQLISMLSGLLVPALAVFGAQKSTIVLVHGAFQDASHTWGRVQPLLEKRGFHVVVVNLPGRDADGSDPKALSATIYRDHILEIIRQQGAPVILVGHSFGGIQISNVAEAAPDKVSKLVYLSAYLPKNGESLDGLSRTDSESDLGKPGNFIVSPDYKYASINAAHAGEIFGNDAAGADQEAIAKSVIPEPLAPLGQPAVLTDGNFGRVPKFYIKTSRDRVVGPALQDRMLQGRAKVAATIDAGHASYFTQPQAVADAIASVAGLPANGHP